MIRIEIKALSVNQAFQGRRFHTKHHKQWSENVSLLLPNKIELPPPPYELFLKFGFSSTLADWDNGIKCFQDSLAKKYGFNDKLIRRGVVETEIVKKGFEFIEFEIKHYAK